MKKLPDIDIYYEYSHIYGHERFAPEHLYSVELWLQELESLSPSTGYLSSILLDDSREVSGFFPGRFLQELEAHDAKPEIILWESRFQPVADSLLTALKPHCREEKFKKGKKKVICLPNPPGPTGTQEGVFGLLHQDFDQAPQYSCALLSASALACKLGLFPFPEESFLWTDPELAYRHVPPPRALTAKSFLPLQYEPVEKKVKYIMDLLGAPNRYQTVFF